MKVKKMQKPRQEKDNILNLSFEEAIAELEDIALKLENPNLGLEESVAIYKRGIELKNYCEKKLENAKMEIQKVESDIEEKKEDNEE